MFLKGVPEVETMIIYTGCPQSLVGRQWLDKYLKKNNLLKEKLEVKDCAQKFRFGPSNVYESKELIEIPINVRRSGDMEVLEKIFIEDFIADAENVPLLCGRNTMKKMESITRHRQEYNENGHWWTERDWMYVHSWRSSCSSFVSE